MYKIISHSFIFFKGKNILNNKYERKKNIDNLFFFFLKK